MEGYHDPVLLQEIIEALQIKEGQWFIDATLGDGGHSLEIIKKGGRVLGVDVDPEALERVRKRFESLGIDQSLYKLVLGNFRNLKNLISQTESVDQGFRAVLFDLGVSSMQLETPERGFSFLREGPLDMRMDPTLQITAADLIKVLTKGELSELISKLGEEKLARRFSEALDRSRQVSSTTELAKVLERAAGGRRGKIHPGTRVFQALRIAVNDELNVIKEGLPQALDLVLDGGLILVISFHSLEDRIVKDLFKSWEMEGLGEIITKKPIDPTEEEILKNPRSRSSKLRIFKKHNDSYT